MFNLNSLTRCCRLNRTLFSGNHFERSYAQSQAFTFDQIKKRRREIPEMSDNSNLPIFVGKLDHHRSITIESESNPCKDINEFTKKLEVSLEKWKGDKLRGVWFNVSIPQVTWIPVLAQRGFLVHHARREGVIVLCLWLPTSESSKIPHFAHTMAGAGAIVMDSRRRLLVVRERYRSRPSWKLPGGYVDPHEDLATASIREVQEETGVKTEFVSLVGFRHQKGAAFGCSDLYFVLRLRPVSSEDQPLVRQPDEIEQVQWMHIDEFMTHPEVHENNRLLVRKAVENEAAGVAMTRDTSPHPITGHLQSLYTIAHPPS